MKRKFTLLAAVLMLLVWLVTPIGMRGQTQIFYESFNQCDGTGGNDDGWNGSVAGASIDTSSTDNPGWTFIRGYKGDQCAKFGTSSDLGSAETPSIAMTGDATLTFKAGAWNTGSESTTLKLSAIGGTLSQTSVTLTKGSFTQYTINITNVSSSVKIKFEGNKAKNSRFFLDEVTVVQETTPTINADSTTYDFHFNVMGSTGWTSTYTEHSVDYPEATVIFANANKSNSTITDIPVTKGKDVFIVLKSGYTLIGATFICRQWGAYNQTITLHYSTDSGSSYTSTGTTSNNFTITNNALPDSTNAVKIAFSSGSYQIGIESATLRFAAISTTHTLTLSVNGVISTADYSHGTNIALPAPTENIPTGFNFLGWTTDANDVDTLISNYTVNDTATLYAVFGETESLVLTPSDFPTSYDTEETEYTFGGYRFGVENISRQGAIQFKANAGYIYNKDAFSNLVSIVTVQTGTYREGMKLKNGSSANPIEGNEINASNDDNTDTYLLTSSNPYILLVSNSSNAVKFSSITFNFSDPSSPRYTRVFLNETATAPITISGPSIIPSGSVLNMGSYELINSDASKLVIEDGGQLVASNDVAATIKKNITGYGSSDGGYYFIASPVDNLAPTPVMTTGSFDLYYFDGSQALPWINYKTGENTVDDTFRLFIRKGYLYANAANTTLEFAGTMTASTNALALDNSGEEAFKGWNLIGNPYPCNVNINVPFFRMDIDGSGLATQTTTLETTAIKPTEGVFVKYSDGTSVTFTKAPEASSAGSRGVMNLNLSSGNMHTDNTIIRFDGGCALEKFSFSENSAKLYIPQDGKDYAVVRSEVQGEMPVNFKATENGIYTISVETNNLDMKYLHLVDLLAGMDINLLQTPNYTFEGKNTDYASRFKLVFSANNSNNGVDDNFGFISNGNIIVDATSGGVATLEIIDITGRIISIQTVNGSANINNVNTPGVYVLRLISNNNVKIQKIVIQ